MTIPITRVFSVVPFLKTWIVFTAMCVCLPLSAQNASQPPASPTRPDTSQAQTPLPDAPSNADPSTENPNATPLVTTREKWDNFEHETVSLLTLGGGTFNAVFSQVTHTVPTYGGDAGAFAERFGASIADIATQNFFGDFVIASALHEDPRYFRMGSGHHFWTRVAYAISRAAVIRKDSGGSTFNFDNFGGSALSTAFSNLYYPPPNRTARIMFANWSIDVADNGFVNLAPEFWPDFRDKVLRRGPRRHHQSAAATNSDQE